MRAHEYIYRKDSVNFIIYKQQVTLKAQMNNKVVGTLLLPTDAHYVKKHRVIKTF